MLEGCVDWPAETAERYRESGLWAGHTLGDELRRWAAAYQDRTAVVGARHRLSYGGLDAWVDRVVDGLRARGIGHGDRVVVQLPNVTEFVVLSFALYRLGALPVHALPAHRSSEITHLCAHAEAVAYVVPDQLRGFDYRDLARQVCDDVPTLREVFVVGEPGPYTSFDALSEPVAPQQAGPGAGGGDQMETAPAHREGLVSPGTPDASDAAFFLLSGGTTALPKLIPRTHDDYLYQVRAASEICAVDEACVYLAVLPLPFNFTWGCPGVLGVLAAGGTVVLAPGTGPEECFELIEQEGVTLTSVVPTVAHLWLEGLEWVERDLSTLRTLQIGSAKLHPEVARRIEPAFGCTLQQVFGMAEGLLCLTRSTDEPDTVLTTQGRPISPQDELRVVDTGDRPVPPGVTGELLTRGPYTLRGYYRAPDHNATAFDADGFYRTGDLVRLTEAGGVVVEGRAKDVIIRGGDKVSATEVERHVGAHERVQQAAVVAVPDPVLGERVCVCVIPDGAPPALGELKAFLTRRGVADFKLPERLVLVDAFPLTGLGKIDKKKLRTRAVESGG
ncbi:MULTISPECIES: (2,3-dihydroxybenzoyl)adenylate synthase [unclassified Streptomyces]|uniref:(2,3-dihydroxybenzoyl)adenylate synthase n=1 Tax=unclassified Streptomyces TaxID=2593676 RepID=UPI00093D139D|nr:AMP-binding protein [Streptomyces sp. TSRI0281]OKI45005.1 2,3-dihydroxybenzoate-AMP ligase [Streptomyces sp. TSRI0281]